MKVIVYHAAYGCETGCCGHIVAIAEDDKDPMYEAKEEEFDFSHPFSSYASPKEVREANFKKFAEDLVREKFGEEHVADLDWENCVVVDD